ncbi:ABC transporter permease subunit [Clostridium intestinale]|jgi:ABC-type transport system involved in multi-copper enzyme maturation permease subunit|uniref:ABC transporter permease subunit n=1 Tax=Clostridium intestinale TaxID=36845 RepID=A0A7D6ZWE3_9CLOT|nr:ABC transporter permease subunit [Clostridium intestinale]QLY78862.1 ABC transporter permease subunit [Clostridium intestinale]
MKNLFVCEFERIWSKKSTWLLFLLIPFVIFASGKYYLSHNIAVDLASAEFTSFGNFPAATIQEQLITFFNASALLIIALSITEEYRTGEIRMVLIRCKSFGQLFVCKMFAIFTTILMMLITYFICSLVIGCFLMPRVDNIKIFYYDGFFTISQSFIYALKYYSYSFITLLAFASVGIFIGIISRSITTAIGSGVGFLLFSLIYPQLVYIFSSTKGVETMKIQLLSITHIQHMGIAMALGERSLFLDWSTLILVVYIVVFITTSYVIFTRSDKNI